MVAKREAGEPHIMACKSGTAPRNCKQRVDSNHVTDAPIASGRLESTPSCKSGDLPRHQNVHGRGVRRSRVRPRIFRVAHARLSAPAFRIRRCRCLSLFRTIKPKSTYPRLPCHLSSFGATARHRLSILTGFAPQSRAPDRQPARSGIMRRIVSRTRPRAPSAYASQAALR